MFINDYTTIEKNLKNNKNLDIVRGTGRMPPFKNIISIIIPTYNNIGCLKKCLLSLFYQNIPTGLNGKIELIIIDDGSKNEFKIERFVKKYLRNEFLSRIVYIKLKVNMGRANARNIGIVNAKGEILIFVDSDIILEKNNLLNHIIRHEHNNKIVTIGFRENIAISDKKIQLKNLVENYGRINPKYEKDFRYYKYIPISWKNVFYDVPKKYFEKNYYVLNKSKYFKKFNENNIFGIWTLPFMFLTSNAGVRKEHIIKVSGFDNIFKGWGMEDTYLAYKLMKINLFFIPVISAVCYHINNGEKDSVKLSEFQKNYKLYKNIIRKQTKYEKSIFVNNINKLFKNKYKLTELHINNKE